MSIPAAPLAPGRGRAESRERAGSMDRAEVAAKVVVAAATVAAQAEGKGAGQDRRVEEGAAPAAPAELPAVVVGSPTDRPERTERRDRRPMAERPACPTTPPDAM